MADFDVVVFAYRPALSDDPAFRAKQHQRGDVLAVGPAGTDFGSAVVSEEVFRVVRVSSAAAARLRALMSRDPEIDLENPGAIRRVRREGVDLDEIEKEEEARLGRRLLAADRATVTQRRLTQLVRSRERVGNPRVIGRGARVIG